MLTDINVKERLKNDHKNHEFFFRNIFHSLTPNVSGTLSKDFANLAKNNANFG